MWSGSATGRPRGERLGRSKHQLIWSSAVQFLLFLSNRKEQKEKKKKRLFKATTRSWLLPWIKISWTHSFRFSLIVTNARNVKYIKWNIYIKRFWTSYYRYNLKEKKSAWTQVWSASLENMNEACSAKKRHKVLFVPTRFTLSPVWGRSLKLACCQLVLWEK